MKITQPTLILNKERVIKNIKKMTEKADKSKVFFRPHFKTHQSAEIGQWFKDFGVKAITVSSVDMAEYFAQNGWDDITIAFPVNINQIERINKLANKITLNLLVESQEVVEFLDQNLTTKVNIWLKIDTGYHRTGIDWDNEPIISSIIRFIKKTKNLQFTGLLVHSGHTYKTKSKFEIEDIYEDTVIKLKNIQERLFLQGFSIVKLSIGDTPTCSVIEDFSDVDEIRPGNFVFYDLTQKTLEVCKEKEIAIALACPIVALHPERNEILIYGGGIHLSKEALIQEDGSYFFGKVAFPDENNNWGNIIEGAYIKSLSQEHGIVKAEDDLFSKVKIGDLLFVLPVHSCMTANLMKQYYTNEGKKITMMTPECEK